MAAELSDARQQQRITMDIRITRPTVFCDPGRVQQLVSNLLGNALTHGSQDHPVRLGVSTPDGLLCIEVANAGEPIDAESLPQIFKPFWRPADAPQQGGGLGLGLFIWAQIVQAHGGRLGVASSREAGTVFTATIPL